MLEILKKLDAKIVAIIALAVIEVVALLKGVNGQLLATTIALIAGIGGYSMGKKQ